MLTGGPQACCSVYKGSAQLSRMGCRMLSRHLPHVTLCSASTPPSLREHGLGFNIALTIATAATAVLVAAIISTTMGLARDVAK